MKSIGNNMPKLTKRASLKSPDCVTWQPEDKESTLAAAHERKTDK